MSIQSVGQGVVLISLVTVGGNLKSFRYDSSQKSKDSCYQNVGFG